MSSLYDYFENAAPDNVKRLRKLLSEVNSFCACGERRDA